MTEGLDERPAVEGGQGVPGSPMDQSEPLPHQAPFIPSPLSMGLAWPCVQGWDSIHEISHEG